jgi:dCTP deaminase
MRFSKASPLPARVNANEGLCQILIFRSDEACAVGNSDRKRK